MDDLTEMDGPLVRYDSNKDKARTSRRDAETDEHRAPPGALSLEKILHALSDPVRLGIVLKLSHEGESSCAALDGGRPKSTMSHQFRVLRDAGLVHTRAQGVTHMNSLCREALDATFPGLLDVILASAGGIGPADVRGSDTE